MEHTQGPWQVQVEMSGDGVEIISDAMPMGVAELATVHSSAEYAATLPAQANARLMAAAPQLLAALLEARADLRRRHVDWDHACGLASTINAAISAAGGE